MSPSLFHTALPFQNKVLSEAPVHVHDFNATILHLLGIDHRRLSDKYQGLAQRLTGVLPARVVRPILA